MLKASRRSFVERLDFRTTGGFLEGGDTRERSGAPGGGPVSVITDFGLLAPADGSRELELVALYEGADLDEARAAVGWPLKTAKSVGTVAPPTAGELDVLRALYARTRAAHSRPARPPVT